MLKALMLALFISVGIGAIQEPVNAAGHAFAGTPLRGWSSWSYFWNHPLSEDAIKAEADAMATNLKASGYEYINVDAGWEHGFDAYGRPVCNTTRFPGGIKALADYVHGKGLKFGIYMQPGLLKDAYKSNSPILGTAYTVQQISDGMAEGNTSGNAYAIDFTKPGSDKYLQSVVDLLASWGVDYIKLDFVGPGGGNVKSDNREELKHWTAAIKRSKRPIWLELSNSLSIEDVGTWSKYANGWRIGGDIENYGGGSLTAWDHVMERFNCAGSWAPYAGPGHWNDLDSLEIGNGDNDGLTVDERKSVMTLWCISCAPLLLGSDLRSLDLVDLAMLKNPELLRIQAGGHPATPISQSSPQQTWRAQNTDGSYTVALFNLGDGEITMSVNWADLGISAPVYARDLWAQNDLGKFDTQYSANVPRHGVVLLRVTARPD